MMASDATALTNFSGDLKEHPVYVSLASIPSQQRQAQDLKAAIMVAYMPHMPTAAPSEKGDAKFTEGRRRLFQAALKELWRPVMEAASEGCAMVRGDKVYHAFPLLWSLTADYQEMVDLYCVKTGWCTSCTNHSTTGAYRNLESPMRTVSMMKRAHAKKVQEPDARCLGATRVEVSFRTPLCL
jgi:hypothetical protein